MRSLLGEETEVVAEHNRVIRMNVSPSLLAKLNSCPVWGLEVVSRSQNAGGGRRQRAKDDPAWIGTFLHRVVEYCIKESGGSSFIEASYVLSDLKTSDEEWQNFLRDVANDRYTLNPLPDRFDLKDSHHQDLKKMFLDMNDEFRGANSLDLRAEVEIKAFELPGGFIVDSGYMDLALCAEFDDEEEPFSIVVVDWKSNLHGDESVSASSFGVQMDVYKRWIADRGDDDFGWPVKDFIVDKELVGMLRESAQSNIKIHYLDDDLEDHFYDELAEKIAQRVPESGPHCIYCPLASFDRCPNETGPHHIDIGNENNWSRKAIPKDEPFFISFRDIHYQNTMSHGKEQIVDLSVGGVSRKLVLNKQLPEPIGGVFFIKAKLNRRIGVTKEKMGIFVLN